MHSRWTTLVIWRPEKCSREKSPPEKSPRENCPPKNYPPELWAPGKLPLGKCHPGKMPPGKLPPGQLPHEKLFYLIFVAFDIILRLSLSKLFIVTSFRGVSRNPSTSIIDFLVTVVNGISWCNKKLLFRCCDGRRFDSEFIRWRFSKMFISKAHGSASDTR